MSTSAEKLASVRLFGAFALFDADGREVQITNKKVRALIALLITGNGGKRTRAFLQEHLWPLSGASHGRASLRGALAALKKLTGARYEQLFDVKQGDEVRVNLALVEVLGGPEDGDFLEGLDIAGAHGFERWLADQRQGLIAGLPVLPKPTAPVMGGPAHPRLRPTVVVLPFLCAGGEPGGATLGDMIADQLSRHLSHSPHVDITSHLSARSINPAMVKLSELCALFDVDYVVTGLMRTSAQAVRIDLDFVDAATGSIAWSQHFTLGRPEFLAGSDETVALMADAVLSGVVDAAIAQAVSGPVHTVELHTLLISAITLMHRQDLRSASLARPQIEQLVTRCPGISVLRGWQAMWYVLWITQGWSTDVLADAERGLSATRAGLQINPNCAMCLAVAGMLESYLSNTLDACVDYLDRSLAINVNQPMAWAFKGTVQAFRGEGPSAQALTDRARFLSPRDPALYLFESLSATAQLAQKDYEAALALALQSAQRNPNHLSTLRVQTIALHGLDRVDEARQCAAKLMRLQPELTVREYLRKHPAARFETGQAWAKALGDSGVPRQ